MGNSRFVSASFPKGSCSTTAGKCDNTDILVMVVMVMMMEAHVCSVFATCRHSVTYFTCVISVNFSQIKSTNI